MQVAVERHVARYFRDQLRHARAIALRDAEAFDAVVVVVERLGRYVSKRGHGLGAYAKQLNRLADASPLAATLPSIWPAYHTPFSHLFELVKEGRNMAVHEGALARHLTAHAVELALVLEDALVRDTRTVADFMVRGPVTAEPWQPLSFIRQRMLVDSFTYLPVHMAKRWWLVSDASLAAYLRGAADRETHRARLQEALEKTVADGGIALTEAKVVAPNAPISEVLDPLRGAPMLVISENTGELLGILTPFDLL